MLRTNYDEQVIVSESMPLRVRASAQTASLRYSTKTMDWLVIALSIGGALRILVLAAAFPLPNYTDERFHLMTIAMFAEGRLPGRDLPRVDPQFAKTFLLYWSPEYGHSRESLQRAGIVGPPYKLATDVQRSVLTQEFYVKQLEQWLARPNYEAQSAPFYYAVAAGWYRLGAAFGMKDWGLDYWVRLLNPFVYGLLVWLSYQFCRAIYPENTFLWIAASALIAVFPQDVFFGMNRDVFSAPLCAAVLCLLVKALGNIQHQERYLLLGSLLSGVAFLSSVANLVLFGVLAAVLCVWVRDPAHSFRRRLWVVTGSVVGALFLPLLWMLRNYVVIGDLTGSKAKERELGWTVKPFAEMFHHPLFSWHGANYFLLNLTQSFWRGEYIWHGVPMRFAWADRFYVLSTALCVICFAVDFFYRRRAMSSFQSLVGSLAVFLVASSILFMAAISLLFDFHDCAYPSRFHPFFVSGRIISGALLPFVLIYARGLELVTERLGKWVSPFVVLTCLMLFITASEFRVRSVVFSSPYNFFALAGWRQ
jgi:hypothetical protein